MKKDELEKHLTWALKVIVTPRPVHYNDIVRATNIMKKMGMNIVDVAQEVLSK